jgi:hypothetical protein
MISTNLDIEDIVVSNPRSSCFSRSNFSDALCSTCHLDHQSCSKICTLGNPSSVSINQLYLCSGVADTEERSGLPCRTSVILPDEHTMLFNYLAERLWYCQTNTQCFLSPALVELMLECWCVLLTCWWLCWCVDVMCVGMQSCVDVLVCCWCHFLKFLNWQLCTWLCVCIAVFTLGGAKVRGIVNLLNCEC